jgi:hypothetical protein
VGSSMITRRASSDSALTISTNWRCASDRSLDHRVGTEVAAEPVEKRLDAPAQRAACRPASASPRPAPRDR